MGVLGSINWVVLKLVEPGNTSFKIVYEQMSCVVLTGVVHHWGSLGFRVLKIV